MIVAVDGAPMQNFEDVRDGDRGQQGRAVALTVRRDGELLELQPVEPELIDGRYRIGFIPGAVLPRLLVRAGDREGVRADGRRHRRNRQSLGGIVTGATRDEVSSAVGIVEQSAQVVEAGLRYYLGMLALISLSLALLNLLPLLPLDGGHIAFSIAGEDPRAGDPTRGLRAGLRDRHRARAAALLHRPLQRHQPPARGLGKRRVSGARRSGRRARKGPP